MGEFLKSLHYLGLKADLKYHNFNPELRLVTEVHKLETGHFLTIETIGNKEIEAQTLTFIRPNHEGDTLLECLYENGITKVDGRQVRNSPEDLLHDLLLEACGHSNATSSLDYSLQLENLP